MHRTIGFLSKRFVQIRPGEGRKVLLTFLYFFLIITAYYVIKPVSRSLLLGELGSRMVPYADLVCAILMGPIVTLFARLVDRVPKSTLVSGAFGVVIGVLLMFWKLIHWSLKWVAAAFYIWVAIFSVLIVTLFWLVANDLYRPREAKRLFGFIGSGGILGGIAGSSIAAVGAQIVGTEHLLLLSAGLLGGCWLVVRQLWRLVPERTKEESAARVPAARMTLLSNIREFAKLLLASRYLLLLVTIVCLNKVVATLVYYQLNPFIEHAFPDPDARTTFMGMFLGGVNVTAFIVQFFFTSWILRRWGLRTALLIWPISVLMGTTGLLCFPVFWLAAGTELCDASLNYSLQQTTKEVLYLPIDRSIRYKVKPFIDMVVFRFGKGFAALVGIVLLDVFHAPPRVLSVVIIPLLAMWLVAAVWLRRDYVATIRTLLQARAVSRRRPDASEEALSPAAGVTVKPAGRRDAWTMDTAEPFGSLTDGRPSLRKLSLLKTLMDVSGKPSSLAQELLADLTDYEMHVAGPNELEGEAPRLKTLIRDPNCSIATRRQAIRLLSRLEDQGTIDYLFAIVMLESDAALRQEAVRGLVTIRLRGVRLDVSVSVIQRQIAGEVANYQRIRRVVVVYRQHHPGPPAAHDAVLGLLRVLMEESVEQVFRLLMLIYRPEDIHLIYERMRAVELHVRTDAIELLDNLVHPATRAILLPMLDEDEFLSLGGEAEDALREPAAAYRAMQEAIWDHNYWLSVTTLCVVGRLRLPTLRQELERASRHRVPLISTAAKVALQLASQS